jgi:hypothetical protein
MSLEAVKILCVLMTLFDIIDRGYFPKELPPAFNTKIFANNIVKIMADWSGIFDKNTNVTSSSFVLTKGVSESGNAFKERKKIHRHDFISKYNSSKGGVFSISKGKLSRRFLQIQNPKHFTFLSEKIVLQWSDFENVFKLSDYSKSYPLPEKDTTKRAVITFSKGVSDFRNELIHAAVGKKIEIKVDIARFYPSIYTHSIAWALLGKEKAKFYFNQSNNLDILIASGDADAKLYKSAHGIDDAIRSCQERQSIGIAIGPDTSHIIAEAVACRIDNILKAKSESLNINLKACRYYDDYYLYVSTKDEADKILKSLQLILTDFQLEINESKVRIKEFPFAFEDDFTSSLFLFRFKETNLNNSLKHYFSLIWGFAESNPKRTDWIFKYSLKIFEFRNVEIPKNSWKVFESLLLKTALIEPSILDIATRILLTYRSYLDVESKLKLKDLVSNVISEHCLINHNFEISWALWLAKTFSIDIEEISANKIIATKDNVANLILLDLIKNTSIVKGSPDIHILEAEASGEALFSEHWLLVYEGVKKGWLTPANPNFLDDNFFFKILKDRDVEFYDSMNQLSLFSAKAESKKTAQLPTGPVEAIKVANIPVRKINHLSAKSSSMKKPAFVEVIPSGLEP